MQRGAYDEARQFFEESLIINQEVGDMGGVAWTLSHLGVIANRLRESGQARQHIIEAIKARLRLGSFGWASEFDIISAQLLESEGQLEQAVELLTFVHTHSEFLFSPHLKDQITQYLDDLKAQLAPGVFAAAVQRGATGDLKTISSSVLAAFSIADDDNEAPAVGSPPPSVIPPLIEPLSARELQVLQLIADGRSTRETAQALFLSVGTIRWYLKQIYGKLHAHNRTQAIARARELNLLT
jgi:ATP/maltotriose-dependent transcriptional regulator MalT